MSIYRILLITTCITLIWSGINPKSYLTWILEIAPIIIVLPIIWNRPRKQYFTILAIFMVFTGTTLTIIGGHYTYSDVPFFNWISDVFELSRNYYDKLVHFVFGMVMAVTLKEFFIEHKIISTNKWVNWVTLSVSISISVLYEFLEWGIAIIAGGNATQFLGAQGDIWDAQSDILYAAIGSVLILFAFNKYHLNLINKTTIEKTN